MGRQKVVWLQQQAGAEGGAGGEHAVAKNVPGPVGKTGHPAASVPMRATKSVHHVAEVDRIYNHRAVLHLQLTTAGEHSSP